MKPKLTIKENFELAFRNHKDNNFQIAIKLYNEILEIDPNHQDTLGNLGLIFNHLEKHQEAIGYYKKLIDINPNHINATSNIGSSFSRLGEYKKAMHYFKKVIEMDQNFTNAYYNLGTIFHQIQENEKAIKYFEKEIQNNPIHRDAHYNLGLIFQKLRDNKKARTFYEKTIEIDPNYISAYNNLAIICEYFGDRPKAINYFEKIVEIDPKNSDANYHLGGMLLGNQSNDIKAVDYFRNSLLNLSTINFDTNYESDIKLHPATTNFFLELTNKCNFHCEFCPSDSQTRLHGYMELSLVKKIFDEISEKKIVRQVDLHLMGEPTLHPKLNEILTYAKSKNVKVSLTTNGSTLVKKRVPKLLDSISGKVIASLMTPTKETYKIRGDVGLSWDRYIDNFQLLIREHLKKIFQQDKIEYQIVIRIMVAHDVDQGAPEVLVSSKSIKESYHEWCHFVETVEKELNLKPFKRQKIDSTETFYHLRDYEEKSYELQKNIKIQFWRAFTFANSRIKANYKLQTKKNTQYCPHPYTDFGVLWNGDVSLCCLDYDATLKVGNVNTHSVEEVMKSKAANKLRASMYGLEELHPTCKKCQSIPVKI